MHQVSGMDGHPENRDGNLEVFQMREAVGNADAARKQVKSGGADLLQVSDRAVGHHAAAAQGEMNTGVHFAPIRAAWNLAEVLNHGDFRSGELLRISPIIS